MLKYIFPIGTLILMWLIYLTQLLSGVDFGFLGIHPRDTQALLGILTAPLVHGNWEHLLSNTLPLLILSMILFLSYQRIALFVWCGIYFFTGLLVWLFARDSFHIGASGIIYGLASFLFFNGIFRMDIKSIAIASGVAIFYGGMVWGVLPIYPGVSWESHLFGGITGAVMAYIFRNYNKDIKLQQMEDEHQAYIDQRKTFDSFLEDINKNKL